VNPNRVRTHPQAPENRSEQAQGAQAIAASALTHSAAADGTVAIASRLYSELMPKPAKPKVTIYADGA
jgi:hypothetical protein